MFAARGPFFTGTDRFRLKTQRHNMAFTTRHETAFGRGLRTIAEASLVAGLGFSGAVLLIGTPIALLVRALHEGLSWLTRFGDMTSPFIEALVAVASSLGGVVLFALAVRFVLGRFRQRRASRHRMKSSDRTSEKALGHQLAEAIS
jgi:hypothetical protein